MCHDTLYPVDTASSVCAHSPVMLQVIVTDTAGMRHTLDPIEAEGVAVAHDTAQQADVVLSVLDCITWLDSRSFPMSDASTQENISQNFHAVSQHQNNVTVLNKADELTEPQLQQLQMQLQQQQQQWGNQSGTEQHPQLQQQQQGGVQQSHVQQNCDQQVAQQVRLQQHAGWQSQQQRSGEQQQQQISQHTSSSSVMSSSKVQPEEEATSLPTSPDELHSTRTVLCSCKTGWNMDAVVRALEQGVQGIMQSGQESEEALVITRYTPAIDAAHHRWWCFADCRGRACAVNTTSQSVDK